MNNQRNVGRVEGEDNSSIVFTINYICEYFVESPRSAFQRPTSEQMNTLLSSFDQSQMNRFQLGQGQGVSRVQETIRGQTRGQEVSRGQTRGQAAQDPFLPSLTLGGQVLDQMPGLAGNQGAQQSFQPASSVRPRPQLSPENHPSEILNRLSEPEQQKFLEQFLSLSPEHQAGGIFFPNKQLK